MLRIKSKNRVVSPVARIESVIMTENRFNDLKILSHGELIRKIQEIDDEANIRKKEIYDELIRREEKKREILRTLGEYSVEGQVWLELVESGGAYGFNEIYEHDPDRCSRAKLRAVLLELVAMGFIKRVEKKYQAVSPDWFQV